MNGNFLNECDPPSAGYRASPGLLGKLAGVFIGVRMNDVHFLGFHFSIRIVFCLVHIVTERVAVQTCSGQRRCLHNIVFTHSYTSRVVMSMNV